MRNVRLRLAYDGSRFFGWQRQEGFESVQARLEDALESLLGEKHVVYGAGRTDTGAHALAQVANVHVDTRLDDERLLFALNAHLPEGITVTGVETCRDAFHAQRDARGKRYGYVVGTTRFRPPFGRELRHWVPGRLDLGAMRDAARRLVGEHDFGAFANAGSPRKSNVRRLSSVHLIARRDAFAVVVQGSGFLYNMVRTIAGTLVDVGRGRIHAAAVSEILASRDRALAGPTAPACGLYLVRVLYDEPTFVRAAGDRPRPGLFPS